MHRHRPATACDKKSVAGEYVTLRCALFTHVADVAQRVAAQYRIFQVPTIRPKFNPHKAKDKESVQWSLEACDLDVSQRDFLLICHLLGCRTDFVMLPSNYLNAGNELRYLLVASSMIPAIA